MNTSIGIKHHY